jgi:hypothetical protein
MTVVLATWIIRSKTSVSDMALSLTSPCVGYLAHLFLKEAVVTLVLQAILNLSY